MKIGAAFALGILMAVGGMGIYAYSWAERTELQHGLYDLNTLGAETASRIDLSLASGRGLADHLSATRDVRDFLEQPGAPRRQEAILAWLDLQTQVVRTRGLSALFLMAPDGRCVASSNRSFMGINFGFRSYFQEAMAGHMASSDWVIGSVTHTPRIFAGAPVRSRGRIIGVLVAEFYVEEVEAVIRELGGKGRRAAVINGEGIVVAHSDPGLQYQAVMPLAPGVLADLKRTRQFQEQPLAVGDFSQSFVDAFLRARDHGQAQALKYPAGSSLRWGAFAPLVGRPWVVVVSIPEDEILRPIHSAQRRTWLMALATALVVFLVGFGLGRRLLRPLRNLADAMKRFGVGDASARAQVLGQDELGRLARTFNGMANTLQLHQEHLEDLVAARTLALEHTLAEVRTLKGMIPICSYCKKIRDDEGGWWQLERYIHDHSEAEFSHGICPECSGREFPGIKNPSR